MLLLLIKSLAARIKRSHKSSSGWGKNVFIYMYIYLGKKAWCGNNDEKQYDLIIEYEMWMKVNLKWNKLSKLCLPWSFSSIPSFSISFSLSVFLCSSDPSIKYYVMKAIIYMPSQNVINFWICSISTYFQAKCVSLLFFQASNRHACPSN